MKKFIAAILFLVSTQSFAFNSTLSSTGMLMLTTICISSNECMDKDLVQAAHEDAVLYYASNGDEVFMTDVLLHAVTELRAILDIELPEMSDLEHAALIVELNSL